MKKGLIEILACPQCKGDLELKISEEKSGEIWTGFLNCKACQQRYPIDEGIPNLILTEAGTHPKG